MEKHGYIIRTAQTMDLTTDPIKLSMAHLNKIIRRVQMVQDFKVS